MAETGQKTEAIINKRFPDKMLDAGKPNPNVSDMGGREDTATILGPRTEFPKPITNDTAWKVDK